MFDLDRFTADCRAARAADRFSKTICEVVKRAVSDPTGLLKSLGEPNCAGIKEIYRSSDLSILSVVWAPRDDHAAQSSYVGGHRRLLRARGQHLLAPHR
jgi:hypothetical protein